MHQKRLQNQTNVVLFWTVRLKIWTICQILDSFSAFLMGNQKYLWNVSCLTWTTIDYSSNLHCVSIPWTELELRFCTVLKVCRTSVALDSYAAFHFVQYSSSGRLYVLIELPHPYSVESECHSDADFVRVVVEKLIILFFLTLQGFSYSSSPVHQNNIKNYYIIW